MPPITGRLVIPDRDMRDCVPGRRSLRRRAASISKIWTPASGKSDVNFALGTARGSA